MPARMTDGLPPTAKEPSMAAPPQAAPPPPHQDHRHARPGQFLAGGPDPAVPGRRRRVPAEFLPRHARGPRRPLRHDPRTGGKIRSPDRHPGRRAGAEAAGRPLRRRAGPSADRPAVPARPERHAGRRPARQPAASRDHRGRLDRLHAAARRRQTAAAGRAQARRRAGNRGAWSAARCPTTRASTCPTWCCRSRR